MGTKVGIVYGLFDQTIHRIVIPDDDNLIAQSAQVIIGQEGLVVLSKADYAYRGATGLAVSLGLTG